MEPEVVPVRRPSGVTSLALHAEVAGICYLLAAVIGSVSASTTRDVAVVVALVIYGASRIVAGWGLLRVRSYGAVLEIVSALVWIALTVVVVAWFKEFAAIVFFAPGVVIAIDDLVYLTRPSIKALFAGPGVRVSPTVAAEWFGLAVVITVLAFIVVPNLLSGHGGSHQKRTMADMRTIATAWEARATDINRYNAAAVNFPTAGVTLENLVTYLSPTYVKTFPKKDGWGNNWQFGADRPWGANDAAQVYTIISYGKDGKSQGKWAGGPTTNFDCDIVYSNGSFIQYPEGVQQQ